MVVQLNISQMIDLALGTPEAGYVNFNALQTLLHVLANQMQLNDTCIELQGTQGSRFDPLVPFVKKSAAVNVTEFSVQPDDSDEFHQNRTRVVDATDEPITKVLVVRDQNDGEPEVVSASKYVTPGQTNDDAAGKSLSDDPSDKSDEPTQKSEKQKRAEQQKSEGQQQQQSREQQKQQQKSGKQQKPGPQPKSGLPAATTLDDLNRRLAQTEEYVRELRTQNGQVASNTELVSNFIDDSRLSASDIDSMRDQIEDIEQHLNSNSDMQVVGMRKKARPNTPRGGRGRTGATGRGGSQGVRSGPSTRTPSIALTSQQLTPRSKELPASKAHATCKCNAEEFAKVKTDLDYIKMAVQKMASCSGMKDISNYLTKDLGNTVCPGTTSRENVPSGGHTGAAGTAGTAGATAAPSGGAVDEETLKTLRLLEKKIEGLDRKVMTSEKRIFDLEKEFGEISDRLDDALAQAEARTDSSNDIAGLFSQISDVKKKTLVALDHCNSLLAARDVLKQNVESLNESLTTMDGTKIDREEVEEMMAEKADYNLVQRKVSTDHFDAVKRELSMGVSEALERLTNNEQLNKRQMINLEELLDAKLEKSDLEEMRDQFGNRIQTIQDRLKALASIRREPEAAATRTKFLRDVACLSCQQNAVMRTEEEGGLMPKTDEMVTMKSNKPQLTYELDMVRKQLGAMPHCRNLHHFEEIFKGEKAKNRRTCVRYCGSSHTTTTAADKFQKTHFPRHVSPVRAREDQYTKGNDGVMYKGGDGGGGIRCDCGDQKLIPSAIKADDADVAEAEHVEDTVSPTNTVEQPTVFVTSLTASTSSAIDENVDQIPSQHIISTEPTSFESIHSVNAVEKLHSIMGKSKSTSLKSMHSANVERKSASITVKREQPPSVQSIHSANAIEKAASGEKRSSGNVGERKSSSGGNVVEKVTSGNVAERIASGNVVEKVPSADAPE